MTKRCVRVPIRFSCLVLTALPEALRNLATLATLDLHDNDLAALPEAMGEHPALAYFGLRSNPIAALPEWAVNPAIGRVRRRDATG